MFNKMILKLTIVAAAFVLIVPAVYGHDVDWHDHGVLGGLDHDLNGFADSDHSGVTITGYTLYRSHTHAGRAASHAPGDNPTGHGHSGTRAEQRTHNDIGYSSYASYEIHSHTLKAGHSHDAYGNIIIGTGETPAPTPTPRQPTPAPAPTPAPTSGGGTITVTTSTTTTDTTSGGGQPQTQTTIDDDKTRMEPVAPPLEKVWVTEYMLLDSGRHLPHWIEVYNPNAVAVDIKGYTFSYATRKFANAKWEHHPQTLESFEIPAKDAIILVSHDITKKRFGDTFGGIEKAHIYQLNINQYVLKSGWLLQDAQGNDIHRIGQAFENDTHPSLGNPVVPQHIKGARQSWHRYKSADAPERSYYGKSSDVATPGFFLYAPAAPAAPALIRPKRFGIWANLKK